MLLSYVTITKYCLKWVTFDLSLSYCLTFLIEVYFTFLFQFLLVCQFALFMHFTQQRFTSLFTSLNQAYFVLCNCNNGI